MKTDAGSAEMPDSSHDNYAFYIEKGLLSRNISNLSRDFRRLSRDFFILSRDFLNLSRDFGPLLRNIFDLLRDIFDLLRDIFNLSRDFSPLRGAIYFNFRHLASFPHFHRL